MSADIPNDAGEDDKSDENIKLATDDFDCFPIFAHPNADECQRIAPNKRANKCIYNERHNLHFSDASGKRDVGADNR